MTFMKLLTSTSVAETWVAMMKTVKEVITLAMSRQFRSRPWTETGTDFTRRLDFVRGADRIEWKGKPEKFRSTGRHPIRPVPFRRCWFQGNSMHRHRRGGVGRAQKIRRCTSYSTSSDELNPLIFIYFYLSMEIHHWSLWPSRRKYKHIFLS